jgi:hypothetical protein
MRAACNAIRPLRAGFLALVLSLMALPSEAYIGPGLGAGVVAAVLGILAGLALLIVGVVWYPVKRMIRRWRSKPK